MLHDTRAAPIDGAMSDGSLLDRIVASRFPSGASLKEMTLALLRQQKATWPLLKEGYDALNSVELQEVACDGYSVTLQYNPKRIVSSGAKVDPRSIKERKCFLCLENLPAEQRGVLYRDQFLVLCNPVPIFQSHCTIAHVNHTPQAIEQYVADFLDLAYHLGPGFVVFYNGPRCGASAPDHMHFQASPAGIIPIEAESRVESRRIFVKTVFGSVHSYILKGLGRQVMVLEGSIREDVRSSLNHLLSLLRRDQHTTEEPMVNILCSFEEPLWRLIIFPRAKHRPDMYFAEAGKQVLISPASVDMGGFIVTPVEENFRNVSGEVVAQIYREVSLDEQTVQRVARAL